MNRFSTKTYKTLAKNKKIFRINHPNWELHKLPSRPAARIDHNADGTQVESLFVPEPREMKIHLGVSLSN